MEDETLSHLKDVVGEFVKTEERVSGACLILKGDLARIVLVQVSPEFDWSLSDKSADFQHALLEDVRLDEVDFEPIMSVPPEVFDDFVQDHGQGARIFTLGKEGWVESLG